MDLDLSRMADNVAQIRFRMAAAAGAAGRSPDAVLLCAACKSRQDETVRLSAALPVDVFGENKAQELTAHYDAGAYLGKPCHVIGHLQTNKVNKVIGRAALIQSVDSLRLLTAIQAEAAKRGITQDILFEVNIGREESKDGVTEEALWPLLDAAAALPCIRVRGLMAIPPVFDSDLDSRRCFAGMRALFEQVKARHHDSGAIDTLSMGMTGSYESAILEGATLVRVGTGIYGARE